MDEDDIEIDLGFGTLLPLHCASSTSSCTLSQLTD